MKSRLTWHFQQHPPWMRRVVEVGQPLAVKVMDPPTENPFHGLNVAVVGRTYEPDDVSAARIWKGAEGAQEWVDKWLPVYQSRPWVTWWELPNEPQPMAHPPFRVRLNEFTVAAVRLMAVHGKKACGLNWSVGWPDVGHAVEFRESLEALTDTGGLLGVHEYNCPNMQVVGESGTHWWTLRIQRTLAELEAAGIRIPRIFVGECGIDGGVYTPKHQAVEFGKGWKSYIKGANDQERRMAYLAQLAWYSTNLPREVFGAAVFTSGPYGDWLSFNVDEGMSDVLAYYIRHADEVVPAPPPTPQFPVIDIVDLVPITKLETRDLDDIEFVVIHHAGYDSRRPDDHEYMKDMMSRVGSYYNRRWGKGAPYHRWISENGDIYITRPPEHVAPHVGDWNRVAYGIILCGALHKHDPTPAQLNSLRWLLRQIDKPIHPHYKFYDTLCPGRHWYKDFML